jgi:hypothetical protein
MGDSVSNRYREHENENASPVNCFSCRHFYITHDRPFPYGCRAAGFKSRGIPSVQVLKHSGIECQMFQRKKEKMNKKQAKT